MMIYTGSKSKVKKKQPKKVREEYEAWCKKHDIDPYKKKKKQTWQYEKYTPTPGPLVRETPYYPSRSTSGPESTSKVEKVYTGDKILGIAAMHKSNLVPIFNSDDAVSVSQMRR